MLLIVKPKTLALHVRAYRKLELGGPDAKGFYALHLERGADSETLPISRVRANAEHIVGKVFDSLCAGVYSFNWEEELHWLYAEMKFKDRPRPPCSIETRDLEPTVRLGGRHGCVLETSAVADLVATMQAGRAVAGLWEPPHLKLGNAHTVYLQNGDLKTFIGTLQALVETVRKRDVDATRA